MITLYTSAHWSIVLDSAQVSKNPNQSSVVLRGRSFDPSTKRTVAARWKLDNVDIPQSNFSVAVTPQMISRGFTGIDAGFEIILDVSNRQGSVSISIVDAATYINVEVSQILKYVRKISLSSKSGVARKAFSMLLSARGHERALGILKRRMTHSSEAYFEWIERNESAYQPPSDSGPLISIVVPVYDPEEKWLRRCIESVERQSYKNWQLCLADDHSPHEQTRDVLCEYAEKDHRIVVTYRKANGRIAAATNSAIDVATGDYIGFLDNDDELAPFALASIAEAIRENPAADFLYSDEDLIDTNNTRYNPRFKPDFSPVLLYSNNYINHFTVVSKELLRKVGKLRSEYDGSQDHDFVLRATRQAASIIHIKKVLYHWRTSETSVASDPTAKMYAFDSGRRAITDALASVTNKNLSVSILRDLGTYKTTFKTENYPSVLVVHSGLTVHQIQKIISNTDYIKIRFVDEKKFNLASDATTPDYLLFLRGSIPSDENWLKEMINYASFNQVAIVGGKILDTQGKLLNTGVTLNSLKDERVYDSRGQWEHGIGYFYRTILPRDIFAVTDACMLISSETFRELGGFDSRLPLEIRGIDLCIRARQSLSQSTIWQPYSIFVSQGETFLPTPRSIRAYLDENPGLRDPYASALYPPDTGRWWWVETPKHLRH